MKKFLFLIVLIIFCFSSVIPIFAFTQEEKKQGVYLPDKIWNSPLAIADEVLDITVAEAFRDVIFEKEITTKGDVITFNVYAIEITDNKVVMELVQYKNKECDYCVQFLLEYQEKNNFTLFYAFRDRNGNDQFEYVDDIDTLYLIFICYVWSIKDTVE